VYTLKLQVTQKTGIFEAGVDKAEDWGDRGFMTLWYNDKMVKRIERDIRDKGLESRFQLLYRIHRSAVPIGGEPQNLVPHLLRMVRPGVFPQPLHRRLLPRNVSVNRVVLTPSSNPRHRLRPTVSNSRLTHCLLDTKRLDGM